VVVATRRACSSCKAAPRVRWPWCPWWSYRGLPTGPARAAGVAPARRRR
jgi:hypothetical protein